jgi:hypothetical protein
MASGSRWFEARVTGQRDEHENVDGDRRKSFRKKVAAGRLRWKEKVEEVVGRRSVEKMGRKRTMTMNDTHMEHNRGRGKMSDKEVQEQE